MKFIQISCREEGEVDLRQAEAVLRHEPDIIFFEAPFDSLNPGPLCNKFAPKN